MKREFKLNEIDAVAKEVVAEILNAQSNGAVVVALSGELGAGKTTLTQSIAHKLGVEENIISPTFVIMKRYGRLVHIDAYRLDSEKELETLGWQELVSNPQNIILIEWPERVPKLIPKNAIWVKLEHIDEGTRAIEVVV